MITLWRSKNSPRWWHRHYWITEVHCRYTCTCSYCRGFPHNHPPAPPMWKKFFTRPADKNGWRVFSLTCGDAHIYVRYAPIWRVPRAEVENKS